jgi:hypothetical protein
VLFGQAGFAQVTLWTVASGDLLAHLCNALLAADSAAVWVQYASHYSAKKGVQCI